MAEQDQRQYRTGKTPEEEFNQGLKDLARGRGDIAARRFQRAAKDGYDVASGLEKLGAKPAPERPKIKGADFKVPDGLGAAKKKAMPSSTGPSSGATAPAFSPSSCHPPQAPASPGSSTPVGGNGEILVNYDGVWASLPNPGAGEWVLVHEGDTPYWKSIGPCDPP